MSKVDLDQRIRELEKELRQLHLQKLKLSEASSTVIVPDDQENKFLEIEKRIGTYFNDLNFDPVSGEITVSGHRYVMLRSDSISNEFVDFVKEKYNDIPESEALEIAHNFLYDNAKVVGRKDAVGFHSRLKLKEPIDKLAAGPVHFAYTGWANVEIQEGSNPVAGDDFLLKFVHHNSFEAQSWKKKKKTSRVPVCKMNSGYSAGWCEESFNIPDLTTVEMTCEAMGDEHCSFIMAPSHRIKSYLENIGENIDLENIEVPIFFKRQEVERELRTTIEQKEVLIKEIHHRVKNNLQVISSLLRLQMDSIEGTELRDEFESTINRVTTMALVHELMYQRKDFDRVNLKAYVEELIPSLVQLNKIHEATQIDIKIDIPEVDLNLERSIPFGLVLNEIICNAFKHGLKKGNGVFTCDLSFKDDQFILRIGDNGPGMKERSDKISLGLALIDILCEQIEAEKEIENSDKGLYYTLKFRII